MAPRSKNPTTTSRAVPRRADPAAADASRISSQALDLDRYVPAHLTFLAGKIAATAAATYRPKFGVGITDWRIMALLATEAWISAGRVCDVTGLDKAAVSRSVREMGAAGLVDVRAVDTDQRRQVIALTRKGLALHDRIVRLAVVREHDLLAELSPTERKTLVDLLVRLRARVLATSAGGRIDPGQD